MALFLGLTMTATLWGNFTLFIDDALIGTNTKPILILAGIIVSEFHGKTIIAKSSASKLYLDLDIPVVAELKHCFNQEDEQVKQLQMHEKRHLPPAEQERLNHYKPLLTVVDDTDKANFIAFGNMAERMAGSTVAILDVAGHGDKYVLSKPIKKTLLDKKAILSVTVITKALELPMFLSESLHVAFWTPLHHLFPYFVCHKQLMNQKHPHQRVNIQMLKRPHPHLQQHCKLLGIFSRKNHQSRKLNLR
ncbi:hypothetical protein PTKIN_Ptkin09bG0187300 [Pterospermum kingtungense]